MGTASHGDIELAYETFGPLDGEPLLLISGTGVQMLIFPEDLCDALVDLGFQVARFDNRDTGLSTHLADAPAPGWFTTMIRPSSAPYRLEDMAEDAVAVLDALGWESAHLVGTSLGGMIAQTLAIRHPSRVRTLTSIMSTPAARIGTMPRMATLKAILKISGMPVTSPDQAAVAMKRLIGSPRYPFDEREVGDIGRRSSGSRPVRPRRPPSPAHGWSPTPAWGTTCPGPSGRPCSARSAPSLSRAEVPCARRAGRGWPRRPGRSGRRRGH
ncbi:alpha/beta fold hydrolase [Streptosporangium roseum]|uniref:alpha/beta fold hydrolase n=1 Tax=Streptosporangium roseum TaxID=2001 RepID=UPI0006920F5D|nr:alpha/beta fold hydrolase [Streptosporangium roseum]